MKKTLLYGIKSVAESVREACETFAWSDEGGLFDFSFDLGLTGMCAIASFALKYKLKSDHDIDVDVVHGFFNGDYGHVWTQLEDELLIDVTATQFNYKEDKYWKNFPKVYITRPEKAELFYPEFGIRNDIDDFYLWPSTQRPYEAIIERILELT